MLGRHSLEGTPWGFIRDDHQRPDDSVFKLLSLEDQVNSGLGPVTACDDGIQNLGLVMNVAVLRLHPMRARVTYKHLSMGKAAVSWKLNKQCVLDQSVSIRRNLIPKILKQDHRPRAHVTVEEISVSVFPMSFSKIRIPGTRSHNLTVSIHCPDRARAPRIMRIPFEEANCLALEDYSKDFAFQFGGNSSK